MGRKREISSKALGKHRGGAEIAGDEKCGGHLEISAGDGVPAAVSK